MWWCFYRYRVRYTNSFGHEFMPSEFYTIERARREYGLAIFNGHLATVVLEKRNGLLGDWEPIDNWNREQG